MAKKKNKKFDSTRFAFDLYATRVKNGHILLDVSKLTSLGINVVYRAEQGHNVNVNAIAELCNYMDCTVQKYL